MKKYWFSILLMATFFNGAFAQNDTLVYFVTAAGNIAPSRQAADAKVVVFPVGSGTGAKLSLVKGFGKDGKLTFSGSSKVHKFPVVMAGDFTEYNPDGSKKSVKAFDAGYTYGDAIYYYPNGEIQKSIHHKFSDDEIKEYLEDGTLIFEHNPTAVFNFNETGYYPNGHVKRTVTEANADSGVMREFYPNGKTKMIGFYGDKFDKDPLVAYYPNGNIYFKLEKRRGDTQFLDCRDSTGKRLIENGNGYFIEYDDNFSQKIEEGKVVNRRPDSVWTLFFLPTIGEHILFKKGQFISFEPFILKPGNTNIANEKLPQFPGGWKKLLKFLSENIKYPAMARANGVTGRVILNFVVEKDGTLSDIKVVKGIGDGCDEEAVRVMKTCPAWIPGTTNGVPERIEYATDIVFESGGIGLGY